MMKGKKLLILGANPESACIVQKANSLGIFTIVTDYDPNSYAKRYASKAENIDASDIEAIVALAKREKVDGVMLGVAEALMLPYEEICSRLAFPCYGTKELFSLFSNKSSFKALCKKNNIPVIEEYGKEEAKLKLPVVIKPVDSSASKGISVAKTSGELEKGIEKALLYSKSKKIIIEKRMRADEVVIYYMIQNGKPFLLGLCDRYTYSKENGFINLPTAYVFPSLYTARYMAKLNDDVIRMLESLNVENGVLFIQSFVDEDGIFRFYEPGFRLNGAQEHYIIDALTGIDAKEAMIRFSLFGKLSDEDLCIKADPFLKGKYGLKLSPLVKTGKIKSIKGLDEIKKLDGVISINPSYSEGDTVSLEGTLKQIVCRFFIIANTPEELKATIDKIYLTFKVEDEEGRSMLLPFFDSSILKKYSNSKLVTIKTWK